MKAYLKLASWLILIVEAVEVTEAMRCWQCAAVDGRRCPEDAQLVNSQAHDSCITWRVGNGTVLLQNLVRFSEECTGSKINFWSKFIDLYYQGTGGSVQCCSGDGCNTGSVTDDFTNSIFPDTLPAELPGAPLSGFLQSQIAAATQQQQQQQQPQTAALLTSNQQPFSFVGPSGFVNRNTIPTTSNNLAATVIDNPILNGASDLSLSGFPQLSAVQLAVSQNGNCQQYFDKIAAEEWLPRILVPLTFDRASETKVGVFYAKFKTYNSNNDHVIVRLIDKRKSNSTMYSIKLFRVGTVSISVSKLEADNFGEVQQRELRKESVNNAINITDTRYNGFWFTVKNEEITLGLIGDQLIEPMILWNDTLREGPRDVTFFGLTTDQASASFGVNCDVPNLHFADTCVTDEDCKDFPNTVCRNEPVNRGLDPGTRDEPFEEWEDRDSLLRSCFCKQGHVRIPQSRGCYDPIRKVVTLRDACFADYHCNDLPNTRCAFDRDVPKFNNSCQCVKGNKPFDPDPRTGLIEGCAPLTQQDKATVLGCSDRFKVTDGPEWVPEIQHATEFDSAFGVDVATVYVNLGPTITGSLEDVAIVRLLDDLKSPRKMYTVKWYRRDGKIEISESTRTRSFFFENERDIERASIDDIDTLQRMQQDYVGYWIQYKYEDNVGGQLSVGLNGAPFSSDYALVKWADTSGAAMKSIKYLGFTASKDAMINFGANCILLNTQIGLGQNPFVQIQPTSSFSQSQQPLPQSSSINLNQLQPQFNFASLASQVPPRNLLRNTASSQPQILTPTSNTNVQRQVIPPGAKPWELPAQGNPVELEIVTEPESTVIEPVLRNQYLTKLKRLLPTFFEDFNRGEIESILLGMNKEKGEEPPLEAKMESEATDEMIPEIPPPSPKFSLEDLGLGLSRRKKKK